VNIVGGTRGTKLVSRYSKRKALSLWGLNCPISILLKVLSLWSFFWGELLRAFSLRSWTIFLFAISNFYLSLAIILSSSLILASLSSLLFLRLFYFVSSSLLSLTISLVKEIFFFLAYYSSLLTFYSSSIVTLYRSH